MLSYVLLLCHCVFRSTFLGLKFAVEANSAAAADPSAGTVAVGGGGGGGARD
jgi:hypothetical protein